MTVGEIQELLKGIDPDKPMHFFVGDDPRKISQSWGTPNGPMIILETKTEENKITPKLDQVSESINIDD